VHLCKLPLSIGTKLSIEFHEALHNLNKGDIKVFETETISSYIEYKSQKGIKWFVLLLLPYAAFMVCMSARVTNTFCILGFFVFQLIQLVFEAF
jgi:L-cystine uptake protein TcyP (sodium:dicarboxylate symporter family)